MKIAIVGGGLVGTTWSILLSSYQHEVILYEVDKNRLTLAKDSIEKQLHQQEAKGCRRLPINYPPISSSSLQSISIQQQLKFITYHSVEGDNIYSGIDECDLVIECVPENLLLKQKTFEALDSQIIREDVIVCSSSSCIPPSAFCEKLTHRKQCLVAHPINPPLFVRLVELVPSPWTSADVVLRSKAFFESIGQKPVLLKKEVPGFAVNRLQYALISAAFSLVHEGILDPEDVDTTLVEGLAGRYAFFGPLTVMHMNANGFEDYVERYGNSMKTVLDDMNFPHPPGLQNEPQTSSTISQISHYLEEKYREQGVQKLRQERDELLFELQLLKQNQSQK